MHYVWTANVFDVHAMQDSTKWTVNARWTICKRYVNVYLEILWGYFYFYLSVIKKKYWLTSKRWTNSERTVNTLWIMSAKGAESVSKRTVNEPWGHSNVWKKCESRTFLGLFVNCNNVVFIECYENALLEMWCLLLKTLKRNSMALFCSKWFAIYMQNLT